ncbi:hypothetical protein NQ314_012220 [Rhamnusium bicolor]|uniref:JmjC domain-containing protein n=1 Tax=Rhamnusium bicolor TaxID=1586634 RepID=A0AAV8XD99_9CUCU|nr:hypothetical protein NQ314_012220 [Rhamnusium bicolor]
MNSNPDELRQLILNSKEPLLFKNLLTSKLLNWNLKDWRRILENKELEFRTGVFDYTKNPQWERTTNLTKGSFDYFLNQTESETKNWLYFDYKYLKDWLTDAEALRDNISWAPLGFPNITADDCTIWIGSKGAHTPCHMDTYGCNLVFQVYGKKLWIVSPPEENLRPTRVPYEESSPQDDEERFNESIVQLLVKQVVEVCNKETNNSIINPNMEQILFHNDFESLLRTLNICKSKCQENLQSNKNFRNENNQSGKSNELNQDEIIEKYKFIEKVPKLSSDQLKLFLEEQSNRFMDNTRVDTINSKENDVLELLNVLTDSDVVSLISRKLLANKT